MTMLLVASSTSSPSMTWMLMLYARFLLLCPVPPTSSTVIGHSRIIFAHHGRPPPYAIPLGLCEGDCKDDTECQEGLFCFQQDPNEPIPGCIVAKRTQAGSTTARISAEERMRRPRQTRQRRCNPIFALQQDWEQLLLPIQPVRHEFWLIRTVSDSRTHVFVPGWSSRRCVSPGTMPGRLQMARGLWRRNVLLSARSLRTRPGVHRRRQGSYYNGLLHVQCTRGGTSATSDGRRFSPQNVLGQLLLARKLWSGLVYPMQERLPGRRDLVFALLCVGFGALWLCRCSVKSSSDSGRRHELVFGAIRQCNFSESLRLDNLLQHWKSPTGGFGGAIFELIQTYDGEDYCVTKHHHPKYGEIIKMYPCYEAHFDTTSYWMKY